MEPSEDIPQPVSSNQAVEFLRVVQQHHIQLSSMADFKANVLLGASLLIFSTTVREAQDHISIPLMLLMATSFCAAALVIMALLPTTSSRHHPAPNLLFFGVFSRMPQQEFERRMLDLIGDEQELHRAMIRDIYQLGHVLHVKKYRRLGQAYQVFFYGLMPSGLAVLAGAAWTMFHG